MPETDKVDLALASDSGAFCGLLVAAYTAAQCATKGVKLVFHVLDGGIADADFEFFERSLKKCNANVSVDRIPVSPETFAGCSSYRGSKMTYARLVLPRILPQTGRILYFDTDFYWRADVVRLWNETRGVVSIAAALDQNPGGDEKERRWYERNGIPFPKERYFCAGLCVINLERWRRDSITERSLDFLRRHPTVECADQTALNAILGDKEVQLFPVWWGRFVRWMTPADFKKPAGMHFSAEAPWVASRMTKMVTDAQLLWFVTDAEIRGISVWKSLRRHYSAMEIVRWRVLYVLVMKIPPCRWLFHRFLAKTGRCFFDERV